MTAKELRLLGKALKALYDNNLQNDLKEIIYDMAEEEKPKTADN